MLDHLLRWLRIRRKPKWRYWWRVTGQRHEYSEWYEYENLDDATRLAGVLVAEGYSVTIKPIDRSCVITSQEAHE